MAVEVIEGTLEPAKPIAGNKKYGRYKGLRITQADGRIRSLGKLAAGGGMLDEIRKGGQGRYYLASSGGGRALIGVRRPDGAKVYSHYMNIEPIVLVVGLLGTLGGIARFGFGVEDFPLTSSILGPMLLAGWYYFRSQRRAQQREVDADSA
jgi:hypothetical protein